jgi:hypothetical protein
LDTPLCPFKESEPFTVLGQGCDGIDQDCNQIPDECKEDKVPPTIFLTHTPPKSPFQNTALVGSFLKNNIQVSDDYAANIDVLIELTSECDCTECSFTLTATDTRCVGNANAPAAVAVRSFSFNINCWNKNLMVIATQRQPRLDAQPTNSVTEYGCETHGVTVNNQRSTR